MVTVARYRRDQSIEVWSMIASHASLRTLQPVACGFGISGFRASAGVTDQMASKYDSKLTLKPSSTFSHAGFALKNTIRRSLVLFI